MTLISFCKEKAIYLIEQLGININIKYEYISDTIIIIYQIMCWRDVFGNHRIILIDLNLFNG